MSRFANGTLRHDEFTVNYKTEPDYFTNPYDLWDADSAKSTPVPTPTKTLAQLQSAMAAHHAREAAELHAAQVAAMVSDIVNWRPIPSDRCDPRVWGAAAARVRAQHWAEREEKGLRFLLERIEEWKGLMAREGLMWMTSAEGDGKVWEVGEERAKRVKMSIGFLLAPFD